MKELSAEELVKILNEHGTYGKAAKSLGITRQAIWQLANAQKRNIKSKLETVKYIYKYTSRVKKTKKKRIFYIA